MRIYLRLFCRIARPVFELRDVATLDDMIREPEATLRSSIDLVPAWARVWAWELRGTDNRAREVNMWEPEGSKCALLPRRAEFVRIDPRLNMKTLPLLFKVLLLLDNSRLECIEPCSNRSSNPNRRPAPAKGELPPPRPPPPLPKCPEGGDILEISSPAAASTAANGHLL